MIFDNSYARLPNRFYQEISPTPVAKPRLIRLNSFLAKELGLSLPDDPAQRADIFSGNTLVNGMQPIAQAYAGHQFGHFVPQLGDGRAVLLGEVVNGEKRFDIQLKGAGKTRFSRGGDGRSPLGPVIREYIVSEAMNALGIPSSRALAMVSTGENVIRETPQPGGILTRVAASFIRVGTFEYFASRKDDDALKRLADYVIQRHYPDAADADNPYAAMFHEVCRAQGELVARWLCVGFIHGVMNTDNTAISGQTIDYGPCAFMDDYDPAQVFSSIDHHGRYAFDQQPAIAHWNMACLGGCLLPLLHTDEDKAKEIAESALASFTSSFAHHYRSGLCAKIGLTDAHDDGFDHAKRLLHLMHEHRVDFTECFRELCDATNDPTRFEALFPSTEIKQWENDWLKILEKLEISEPQANQTMRTCNPAYIPRNHRVEEAIRAAEDNGDYSPTHHLIDILSAPYDDQPEHIDYRTPPSSEKKVRQTFCGT